MMWQYVLKVNKHTCSFMQMSTYPYAERLEDRGGSNPKTCFLTSFWKFHLGDHPGASQLGPEGGRFGAEGWFWRPRGCQPGPPGGTTGD